MHACSARDQCVPPHPTRLLSLVSAVDKQSGTEGRRMRLDGEEEPRGRGTAQKEG